MKNGRDEQLVIRTETFEELLEAKKEINIILDKVAPKQLSVTEAKTKGCECGGIRTFREGVSKTTGKKWAGWFCSNPDCKPEFINYSSKV